LADPIRLRPYRIRNLATTQFFEVDATRNEEWCAEDLAKSGLTSDDMLCSAVKELPVPDFATATYHIPYFDLNGRVLVDKDNYNIMWRTRQKVKPFADQRLGNSPKYLQPKKDELAQHDLPGSIPYLLPYDKSYDNGTIFCCEGEKKTASVIKHLKVAAFGIAGNHMWKAPDGLGGIHPWITKLLVDRKVTRIFIIPDADVSRYDMSRTYGAFTQLLRKEGYEVKLLNPPGKIDDLIIGRINSGEPLDTLIEGIPEVTEEDLVQTPAALAKLYNLAFRTDKTGIVVPYQHTSNVMKLLESEIFEQLWLDYDRNIVYLGEEPIVPMLTDMKIANFFQHNLGFDRVSQKMIQQCMAALAKQNRRSPMLDWIKSQEWDGQERLDTWMSRLWGVEDTEYTRQVASKWLISACARMAQPGAKVDWMMIMIGPQGTGKTSMPGILFRGNSLTLYGDHNDKDLHMLLHSALVVGFDELDSFSRKDAAMLKAMITRTEDMFRPPYGITVETFSRRFVLYGCGNRQEFLQHDPSGYRRYAIVETRQKLDFAGLEREVPQLWAEAWHRYNKQGVNWWELDGASEQAEKYVVPNIMEEDVINAIAAQRKIKYGDQGHDKELEFTMSQLLAWLNLDGKAKNSQVTREISGILRGMGCAQKVRKVEGKALRVYSIGPTSDS